MIPALLAVVSKETGGKNWSPMIGKELMKRKALLSRVIDGSSQTIPCSYVEANGIDYFESVVGMGLEGIVAKRKDSLYQFGKRGDDWLKVKSWKVYQVLHHRIYLR